MSENSTTADNWHLGETGRIIVSVVFGGIILIGGIGNLLVISLIVLVRKLHSKVNMCLACLAVADLMVLAFLPIIPWNMLYDLDDSSLGLNFCVFVNTVDRGAQVCTTLIFLLVGVERFTVLCHPLKSIGWWTRRKVGLLLVIISLVTIAISVPYGYETRYEREIIEDNKTVIYCFVTWDPWLEHYETAVNCVFFFVPVPVLCVLYGKMIMALKAKVPQNDNQRTVVRDATNTRSKVVRMLAVVVSVFILCLLPFKVFVLVDIYAGHVLYSMDDMLFFITNWSARILLYVNHASNPIVYFLMSDNFRQAFKTVFCGRCKTLSQRKSVRTTSSSLRGDVVINP